MRKLLTLLAFLSCGGWGQCIAGNVAAEFTDTGYRFLAADGSVWLGEYADYPTVPVTCGPLFGGVANIPNGTFWRVRGLRDAVSYSLRADGTVWLSSMITYDRSPFGLGQISLPAAAVQVSGLVKVKETYDFRYALTTDGKVWYLDSKFAADPTDKCNGRYSLPSAEQLVGLDNVLRLRGGMAIKSDGTVWDLQGKVATRVPLLDGAVDIFRGGYVTLFLKADGSLWGYGDNSTNQLGRRWQDLGRSDVPLRIENVDNIKEVALGSDHVVVLKNDGSVWAWGANSAGQICPPGETPCASEVFIAPVQLRGIGNDALHISAGNYHTAIIMADGAIVVIGRGGTYGIVRDDSLAKGGLYLFGRMPFNVFSPPADSDADRILDFLEQRYSSYLAPAGSATQTGAGYTFRYYRDSKAYLGSKDGRLWYLPPGGSLANILDVGAQADWLEEARRAGY